MKLALQKKMGGMKNKKQMVHPGDSMHEGGEIQDHPDLGDLSEHEKSGSDLAPPIVNAKPGKAEHMDELMADHDVHGADHPNHNQLSGMTDMESSKEEGQESDEEKAESDKLDKILSALGARGGSHMGRNAGSLRERVADQAKEKFAAIHKEKSKRFA